MKALFDSIDRAVLWHQFSLNDVVEKFATVLQLPYANNQI